MSTQVSTISPQQLHEVKRRGRYAPVLDVRSVAEYRAGHIPGAQLIPVDTLSADALAHAFKRPSLGREETLYVTCHTGPRALQAAEQLQRAGFDNLRLIEGGTQRWEELGLPLERCGRALSLERQVQIAIGRLLTLSEDTLVYPAHDYNGMTLSTIGEEKRHNPRLQVTDRQAYIELMNGLELDDPKLMDVAVPANRACGTRHAA